MCCIGVISKNKNLQIRKNNIQLYYLTKDNIKDYQNKQWDILVIKENIFENEILVNILKNTNYLLIEDSVNLKVKLEKSINIITFGFRNKSTVTISSVQEDETIICIQRKIKTINKKIIDPMEISVKCNDPNKINDIILKKIIYEILEK